MASINVCQFIGNITRDPESKTLPNGTFICEFGIAVNREWKTDTGEKREAVTFINLKAWSKKGEIIARYCHKGDPIYVSSRAEVETWDDKESGAKRSKTVFVVEDFQFLGGKKNGETKPRDPDLDPAPSDIPFDKA